MNRTFWRSKKVLLTGHTGFKGSWLSLWLQQLGADLIGYSLPAPTKPSLFESAQVAKGMRSIEGDIRDFARLKRTVSKHRPDIVIHMAAQSLVLRGYQYPLQTYAVNFMGTVNLLEVIRQIGGVRVAINVTSDKCYENLERGRNFREDDPMGGRDPYSSSKGCSELATSAYLNSYFKGSDNGGTALASARAGNVIGGGDWARYRLVPDIVRAFMGKQPISIRNPQAIRPWQHVLEPLSGYLLLAERLWDEGSKHSGAWNFGPNKQDAKPVSWVAHQMAYAWGNNARVKINRKNHPHEASKLRLDCSKAKRQLGWTPRTDLKLALAWVVEWYKRYAEGANPQLLTRTQIDNFSFLHSQ